MILQYSTGHYRCTDVQMNSISVIVKEGEGVGDGRGVYGCPGRKVGSWKKVQPVGGLKELCEGW